MPPHPHDHTSSSGEAPASAGIRLQRFLAATGLGSRRKCEEYIVEGRVSVDGQVVRDLGTRVNPQEQEVRVDTERVRRDPPRYFLLNKPRGYLCTSSDPAGRPRAIDLVPAGKLRLFTVGRLDEGSEGLILLTNDGELAHRLAHPRFQVPRTYALQVAGRPTPETFATLKEGLYFQEGRFRIHWVKRAGTKGNSTFLEVGLSHGQNREIRRLFARVGHKVMRLRRVAFGPLSLGRLAEGRCRPLTSSEMNALRELASSTGRRRHKKSPDRLAKARATHTDPSPGTREEPIERPRAGKQRAQGRSGRPVTREDVGAERQKSNQGAKRRTRNGPGTSQHVGHRHGRSADVRSQEPRSRGTRKRRQRHG
ncbi:MAG TPA: pseudouridine synthase [Planctomycetaceae bacterium]|jgi:23S rRNA pseudouridine2605 synthase|nr:pseudouridine synthase [Planctomycetaceae bacterium]